VAMSFATIVLIASSDCAAFDVCTLLFKLLLSLGAGKQSFQRGAHSDDISCLAMHPSGRVVATGEVSHPSIHSHMLLIMIGKYLNSLTLSLLQLCD
jgi:hypothetical protein